MTHYVTTTLISYIIFILLCDLQRGKIREEVLIEVFHCSRMNSLDNDDGEHSNKKQKTVNDGENELAALKRELEFTK